MHSPDLRAMKMSRIGVAAALLAACPAYANAPTLITQKNLAFSLTSLTLAVGDKLTIHNADDVTHNITVKDGGGDLDDLGLQKPTQDVSYNFDAKGSYRVICSIHPRMKLIVTVK